MKSKKRLNYLLAYVVFSISMLALLGAMLRDPTEPPADFMPARVDGAAKGQALTLNAVFIRQGRREAIINGQTLREGDQIGEYIITTINIDTVELLGLGGNQNETLRLSADIKRPVRHHRKDIE